MEVTPCHGAYSEGTILFESNLTPYTLSVQIHRMDALEGRYCLNPSAL